MTPIAWINLAQWNAIDLARIHAAYRHETLGATPVYTQEQIDAYAAEQVAEYKQDAERYRWLKSRDELTLSRASPGNVWTRPDGTKFTQSHYLAEGGTQYAATDNLDAAIDAAIRARAQETTAKESLPVPDLDHCPSCGGPADNGNDREYPPNPYVCSKCDQEHRAKYARAEG